MGFAYARTKVESAATGYHHGWNVSADANWLFRISLEDENLIKAKAEKETSSRVNMIFSPGLHAQFITMSASNWLSDGSRYRAWDSIGLGPELNLGLEFTNSMTMHKNGFLFSICIKMASCFLWHILQAFLIIHKQRFIRHIIRGF